MLSIKNLKSGYNETEVLHEVDSKTLKAYLGE